MSERPPEKTLAELASPNHECRACGYVYIPSQGDQKTSVSPGTPFEALPLNWKCPVCGAPPQLLHQHRGDRCSLWFCREP